MRNSWVQIGPVADIDAHLEQAPFEKHVWAGGEMDSGWLRGAWAGGLCTQPWRQGPGSRSQGCIADVRVASVAWRSQKGIR